VPYFIYHATYSIVFNYHVLNYNSNPITFEYVSVLKKSDQFSGIIINCRLSKRSLIIKLPDVHVILCSSVK